MTVEVIRAPTLTVPHGFLGRRGGVSTSVHAGLNVGLGSDDDPKAIAENRRRAADAVLPGGRLVSVFQVHSADAVTVADPWDDAARPHADALVTDRGAALGPLHHAAGSRRQWLDRVATHRPGRDQDAVSPMIEICRP